MKKALILATLCAVFTAPSRAPVSAWAQESNGYLTVDDVVNLRSASGFDISPDGSLVAWVKRRPDAAKNERVSNIMLTYLSDTTTVYITRGTVYDDFPRFSPDGKRIAFLGKRGKGKNQIFLFDPRGGEPQKITDVSTGVKALAWRDTDTILFTAREDSTLREHQLKNEKDDVVVVADQEHYQPVRLFSIDVTKRKVRRLTTNRGVITEFAVSPDGRWVVTNENQDVNYRYDYKVPPKQFLIDLQSGEREEIFIEPHDNPFDFEWSPDSKGFYFRKRHSSDPADDYVSITHLYYHYIESRRDIRVDEDWDKGLGFNYVVTSLGAVASLANGTEDRITLYVKNGERFEPRVIRSPRGMPMALHASQPGGKRLVYALSTASTIPEIVTATLEGDALKGEFKLFDLNESLKKKMLSRTELVSWNGALGDRVEGILYYPPDYRKGRRFPLIALIHGGPAGVDRNFFSERWSNYPHVLSSKGTFVLKINYHGSGNYGLPWMESIKGRYYELEVPDILKGVDHFVKKGLADPERLGIMGWSNGSILAIECCIRSDRFKALCAGAGDVNWTSDYGNCAFGAAFDNAYFGGPPWKNPSGYVEKSPIFELEKVTTPTLILFGEKDTNVPTEQGWQHFRALQQIGKVPVRFLLFPGTGHGLRKLSHQKRKMEEELSWFERYLFERTEEKNEALAANSPLELELRKRKAARTGRIYGETVSGILVPELVYFEGMRVGRFEITRAQFHAFDPGYQVEPGSENLPASSISLERATAYCRWLSERTNRLFRLPTPQEMEKLLQAARSNIRYENNLERWAGYEPTPDERAMLTGKLSELEEHRLLLEEVGSFRPVGEVGVYDLGGNVAEWTLDGEGEGRIMGLSAVSTRDTRAPYQEPDLRYVGFRVVEEAPSE